MTVLLRETHPTTKYRRAMVTIPFIMPFLLLSLLASPATFAVTSICGGRGGSRTRVRNEYLNKHFLRYRQISSCVRVVNVFWFKPKLKGSYPLRDERVSSLHQPSFTEMTNCDATTSLNLRYVSSSRPYRFGTRNR